MIEQIVDINNLESSAQGQYRVIQQVYKGDPQEIDDLREEIVLRYGRDRGQVRFVVDISPSFEFDHHSFTTVDKSMLVVTAVVKTDRLGA